MSEKAISELMDGISPRPWDWSQHRREDGKPIESVEDIVAIMARSARFSERLELNGVVGKENGEDIVVCYTGNGPKAAANARFLANAPEAIDWLMSKLSELQKELEAARAKSFQNYKHADAGWQAHAVEKKLKEQAEAELAKVKALLDQECKRDSLIAKECDLKLAAMSEGIKRMRELPVIIGAAMPHGPHDGQEKYQQGWKDAVANFKAQMDAISAAPKNEDK